jgi:hypothetical protein
VSGRKKARRAGHELVHRLALRLRGVPYPWEILLAIPIIAVIIAIAYSGS